jgi:hypothetical protein
MVRMEVVCCSKACTCNGVHLWQRVAVPGRPGFFFLCVFVNIQTFVSGTAADGVSAACTCGSPHFAGIGVCSCCPDQAAEDGNERVGD